MKRGGLRTEATRVRSNKGNLEELELQHALIGNINKRSVLVAIEGDPGR